MPEQDNEFCVYLENIHKNRRHGISGMMRVKDDAEFIVASVESCIDALDELVIVYNGCTDESPQIINRLKSEYPDKIRVYDYQPRVICGSLSHAEYERAKALPDDSPELLSNYYNYALSKTTCSHVLKIDADQIYFSENLKALCDRIRSASIRKLSFHDIAAFLKVARKMRYFTWRPSQTTHSDFKRYRRVLEYLCAKGVLSVALSGINVVVTSDRGSLVPQGLVTGKLNILGQFNGSFDHLIFKVKEGVRFVPSDNQGYAVYASAQYTYIERLVGNPRGLSWGFMWWHLNAMRIKHYRAQLENIVAHPEAYVSLDMFLKKTPEQLLEAFSRDFVSTQLATNYLFYWIYCRDEIDVNALKRCDFGYIRPVRQS